MVNSMLLGHNTHHSMQPQPVLFVQSLSNLSLDSWIQSVKCEDSPLASSLLACFSSLYGVAVSMQPQSILYSHAMNSYTS